MTWQEQQYNEDYEGYGPPQGQPPPHYYHRPLTARIRGLWPKLRFVLLVALIAALATLAAVVRTAIRTQQPEKVQSAQSAAVRTLPVAIHWESLSADVSQCLEKARQRAAGHAAQQIKIMVADMRRRTDERFLPEHFSYLRQQELGWKSLLSGFKRDSRQQHAVDAEIDEHFSASVLQPGIAQARFERIVANSASLFVSEAARQISVMPAMHGVPEPDWQRFSAALAGSLRHSGRTRRTGLGTKTFFAAAAPGIVVAAGPAGKALAPHMGRRAGARAAAGTLPKLMLQKALMPMAAVLIGWEAFEHNRSVTKNTPVVRDSIESYLNEIEHTLNRDVALVLDEMELSMLQHVRQTTEMKGK